MLLERHDIAEYLVIEEKRKRVAAVGLSPTKFYGQSNSEKIQLSQPLVH